ncbi:MAG: septum formation protein Maf [Proteobacteria bacterium]|nr:septum formation protein Maf [Pseudomonadota bacterium]
MTAYKPIILASASPRRRKMFKDLGLEFEVIPAQIEEQIEPDEKPEAFTRRVAEEKARAVAERLKPEGRNNWIVGADTVVVLDGEVLQKPKSADQAHTMLSKLSGRTHTVVTGWTLGRNSGPWIVEHAETSVTFHKLNIEQIDGYVVTGEGMDKAGAYAIQGIGTFLVDRIDGNYFNVVGLPISHVVQALIQVGALPTFPVS